MKRPPARARLDLAVRRRRCSNPSKCLEGPRTGGQTRRPLTASSVQSRRQFRQCGGPHELLLESSALYRLRYVYDTWERGACCKADKGRTLTLSTLPRQRERGRTISTRVLEGLLGAPRGGAAVHGIQRTNSLQADLVVRAVTVRQPATRREKVLHRLGPAARLLRALHAEAGGDV